MHYYNGIQRLRGEGRGVQNPDPLRAQVWLYEYFSYQHRNKNKKTFIDCNARLVRSAVWQRGGPSSADGVGGKRVEGDAVVKVFSFKSFDSSSSLSPSSSPSISHFTYGQKGKK